MVATDTRLTPSQAARELGLSVEQVRFYLKSGRLPCEWTPYGRVVQPAAVEAFKREREARRERIPA